MIITLPLQLLRLPVRSRLALALGTLVLSMSLYELFKPSPLPGGGLLLSLILTTWLFGWQGGLLALASITLLLAASYGIGPGIFRPSTWLVAFLTGTGYRLVVCLTVGGLRRLTLALLHTRETIAHIERAYQQERARNERKDQALQDLRHELRTPLTQIQGYLDLLGTFHQQCDITTRARFIAVAQSGCEELLNVIETNLATAQASTKQPPRMSIFPLKRELQNVLTAFGPEFLWNHPVRLEMAEAVLVHAEPHFVRQIMRNLLTNIDKYTPPATCVTVTAAATGARRHSARERPGAGDLQATRRGDGRNDVGGKHGKSWRRLLFLLHPDKRSGPAYRRTGKAQSRTQRGQLTGVSVISRARSAPLCRPKTGDLPATGPAHHSPLDYSVKMFSSPPHTSQRITPIS